MKRFLICLMTVALLLSATVVLTSAADYEEDASFWSTVQLNALYITNNGDIYSDLAEDYIEWWWEEEEYIDDAYYSPATINMRGFAMSPNGDYAYMGTLNGGDGLRGVVVLNTVTGVATDLYYHHDSYPEGTTVAQGPFSYAKGIDTDSRGYVYVGFAYSNNYNVVNLGIAKQESDGTLTEVSFTPVWEDGVHGDTTGTHVGVNGVDVVTIGDKTYCYVVVNYDVDALYCFDVTDPANPVLNEEFGEDGRINFSDPDCPVAVEGIAVKELQYLDVDDDGTIWLVMYPEAGTNGVMCITPDGSACTSFFPVADGDIYSINSVGDFLLCGSKGSSYVYVATKDSGELVHQLIPATSYGNRITRMAICNDVLYVCDAGNDNSYINAIYAGALSESGLAYIQNVVKSLNGEFETEPEETQPTETAPDAEETKAPDADETKAPDAEETKAPDTATPEVSETVADTAADTTPSTDKIDEEGGCGSIVLSGTAVVALLAAAFVVSKRK